MLHKEKVCESVWSVVGDLIEVAAPKEATARNIFLQESRDLLKLARRHSGRGKHQVLERLPTAGRLVRLNCPVRHLCQRMRN